MHIKTFAITFFETNYNNNNNIVRVTYILKTIYHCNAFIIKK